MYTISRYIMKIHFKYNAYESIINLETIFYIHRSESYLFLDRVRLVIEINKNVLEQLSISATKGTCPHFPHLS